MRRGAQRKLGTTLTRRTPCGTTADRGSRSVRRTALRAPDLCAASLTCIRRVLRLRMRDMAVAGRRAGWRRRAYWKAPARAHVRHASRNSHCFCRNVRQVWGAPDRTAERANRRCLQVARSRSQWHQSKLSPCRLCKSSARGCRTARARSGTTPGRTTASVRAAASEREPCAPLSAPQADAPPAAMPDDEESVRELLRRMIAAVDATKTLKVTAFEERVFTYMRCVVRTLPLHVRSTRCAHWRTP